MSSAQLGGHAASPLQQPASHTGAHGSQPQRGGRGADPAHAEPTRRREGKWTANQEKAMTSKHARDDRAHTHTHTHTFESQVRKSVPPKRGTGPRKCVTTHTHTPYLQLRGARRRMRIKHTHTRTYVATEKTHPRKYVNRGVKKPNRK